MVGTNSKACLITVIKELGLEILVYFFAYMQIIFSKIKL